jgi:hypothetical protein
MIAFSNVAITTGVVLVQLAWLWLLYFVLFSWL